jgi:RNA polymerase sigma factor (sigma-70 family)
VSVKFRGKRTGADSASVTKLSSGEFVPIEDFVEDPLEQLLDEQSDEEFGSPSLVEARTSGSGESVRLADWTAQEFSSIYLRFRPHLERHARRFLNNQSQVDEVVQDAFLYLMVSLPELDSEVGVLRFLKWKTRLLALDVIRASGRAYVNSIDDIPEPESADLEISAHLEQQDDAAVVKLALSKLNPRHREVLIASLYEEKSTDQIASQIGLSENATRQLIFRARAAFKKALVGDTDTTGLSASAILSVAARKAAADGKKIAASAMALVALIAMALTAFPTINRAPADLLAGNIETPGTSQEPAGPIAPDAVVPTEPSTTPENSSSSQPQQPQQVPAPSPSAETPTATPALPAPESNSSVVAAPPSASRVPDSFASLNQAVDQDGAAKPLSVDQNLAGESANGVAATFLFNSTEPLPFRQVLVSLEIRGIFFELSPQAVATTLIPGPAGSTWYRYEGQIGYVFDEAAGTWARSSSEKSIIRLVVLVAPDGFTVTDLTLTALPR